VKSSKNNQPATSKDKKFQNLQSSILSHQGNEMPAYNPDVQREEINTDWKQSSGKLVNKGSTKVDTFKKLQQQQQSSVFELPDYDHHVPMKKKRLDINNVNDQKRKNDHLYSDLSGNNGLASSKNSKSD
jgi:hypothetical protein